MYKLIYGFLMFASFFLVSCGGGSKSDDISGIYDIEAYSEDAPEELVVCALKVYNENNFCTLEQLSIIGMETDNPSKQDIADRLVVSHRWMGDRFMVLLDKMPEDIRLLLRSVTAIVIDADIRPSFYTQATGAIYLDPQSLWLSAQEEKSISKDSDYRAGFDDELNYASLWRYLNKNGTWARPPGENRQLKDLVFPLSELLYHELAHANTFLPPSIHDQIDPEDTVIKASKQFENKNVSLKLKDQHRLQSKQMKDLALVRFFGERATKAQKALTGTQVGAEFETDRASDDYAYIKYSDDLFHEDTAMLFEELLVKYHFNNDREIAFTNQSTSTYCNDYVIAWGQTGRIGHPDVKEAARLVSSLILPEVDLNNFIDNLDAPTDTTPGIDWCAPFLLEKNLVAKGTQINSEPLDSDISSNRHRRHSGH